MRILFIGDIVGESGREVTCARIGAIKRDRKVGFVIANAENSAGGKGLTKEIAGELSLCGVNVFTLGNHTFARKEVATIIDDLHVLRPANYPPEVPGHGWGIYEAGGLKIAVISLMGRVYMPLSDCPFRKADEILCLLPPDVKIIVVDFHAEITSEKIAMGWYLNGRVSAVIGTHTHVQTADERILPEGTAYITDAGMTGPKNGIIGMDREIILKKYLTAMPIRFNVAPGEATFNGCIIEVDDKSGRAVSIERVS
jgi:hypothetical protein